MHAYKLAIAEKCNGACRSSLWIAHDDAVSASQRKRAAVEEVAPAPKRRSRAVTVGVAGDISPQVVVS